jgi:hypothetical protein
MSSKEDWPSTEAVVYSVGWFDPSRNDFGHYKVVYSYRVGEERYIGEFRDYINRPREYLHPNDTISIRYNPEVPSKSFYPLAHSATNRRLFSFAIAVGLATIVLLILYFTKSLNQH